MEMDAVQAVVNQLPTRQRDVLDQILEFYSEFGYPPSIKQLCERCGVSSTSTIHHHITALKKKGLIDWNPAEKRSICVIPELAQGSDGNSGSDDEGDAFPGIPLLGTIAAGSPLQTYSDSVEHIQLDEAFCADGCYALRVKGLSMIEDHILDGDVIIVNPKAQVRDGDVAVALVDGETATLKRIYREANGFRLQPANSDMEPIFAKDVTVQGKLEAVLRRVQ